MATHGDAPERARFAWARTGFDLEGLVGAVAAWLAGVLLGLLWDPLFWIGFGAALVILLAARRVRRTPPDAATAIVAPVDGVVVDARRMAPPAELRLAGEESVRIRIASSPASPNPILAPIAGEVEAILMETGDPSVVMAMEPDTHGLSNAYLTLTGETGQVGLRVATGGLGPRLDIDLETGDPVRLGRQLGKRRLGGWCDVYLPADLSAAVWPGMTLVAGETVLSARARTERASQDDTREATAPAGPEAGEAAVDGPTDGGGATTAPAPSGGETGEASGATGRTSADPAEMFARLRSRVEDSERDPDPDPDADRS